MGNRINSSEVPGLDPTKIKLRPEQPPAGNKSQKLMQVPEQQFSTSPTYGLSKQRIRVVKSQIVTNEKLKGASQEK